MVGIMSSSADDDRNLSASSDWCWSQGWRALTYSLTSCFACACAWSCSIICRFLWWANVLLVFIITVNHFSESQPLLCKLIIKLFLLQEFVVYCVRLPTHFLSVLVLRWWGAGLCFWHPLRCPHKPPLDKRGADYTFIFSHIYTMMLSPDKPSRNHHFCKFFHSPITTWGTVGIANFPRFAKSSVHCMMNIILEASSQRDASPCSRLFTEPELTSLGKSIHGHCL